MLNRLLSNRYSRPILRDIVRRMASHQWSREILNRFYLGLSWSQRAWFHGMFASVFKDRDDAITSGTWKIQFGDKLIKLPITRERLWLDWESALSVVGHDIEVKQTYEELLKGDNPPQLFIDIGANYGTHSLLFLTHQIQTITFEPNAACYDYLNEICSLNHLRPDLRTLALGDTSGEIEIRFPEKETWLGSVNSRVQQTMVSDQKIVSSIVPIERLDSVIETERPRRVLMKIDVEGNELAVLKGAERFLDQLQPNVILECFRDEDTREGLFQYFDSRGYQLNCLPWRPSEKSVGMTFLEFNSSPDTNFMATSKVRLERHSSDEKLVSEHVSH